jgi:hypothetical protein
MATDETDISRRTGSPDRLVVFDTTLRDGEQAPGCSMTDREKLRIARALADLGVDIIEAGFPAASDGDFESVRMIATEVRGPTICALARCGEHDGPGRRWNRRSRRGSTCSSRPARSIASSSSS